MLAVFLVLMSCIGLLLNWPVLGGFFRTLTMPLGNASLEAAALGYSRPDGLFLIGIALAMVFTLFISTKPWLIVVRSLALSILTALLMAELFVALMTDPPKPPIYSLIGLAYSVCFLFFAFLASTLKVGSNRSLVSTLQGTPMSESQALTQGIKETLQIGRTQMDVRLTALDQLANDFPMGNSIVFSRPEVNIGRDDTGWAHLRVGSSWQAVSRKHLILQVVGNSLLVQPIARSYAYAINGQPRTMASEVPQGAELSLVSGNGPRLKVEYTVKKVPALSTKAIAGASRAAAEEFRRMQYTMKIFILLVLLGLPLGGAARFFEKLAIEKDKAEQERKYQETEKNLRSAQDALTKSAAETEQARKELQALETTKRQQEAALREMLERQQRLLAEKTATEREREALQSEIEAQREEISKLQNEIERVRIENSNIQAYMMKADEMAKQLDAKLRPEEGIGSVFPIIAYSEKSDKSGSGSGFILASKGNYYLATAAHCIPEEEGIVVLGIKAPWTREWDKFRQKIKELSEKYGNNGEKLLKEAMVLGIIILPASLWERDLVTEYDGLATVDIARINVLGKEAVDLLKSKPALEIGSVTEPGEAVGIFGYPVYNEEEVLASYSVGTVASVESEVLLIRGVTLGGFSGSPVISFGLQGGKTGVVGVLSGMGTLKGIDIATSESLTFALTLPQKFRE